MNINLTVHYVQDGAVCVLAQNHQNEVPPSAVQFRMGGCKGVLAVNPNLGDKDKIVIRTSMEKFKCTDKELEVISFSRPRKTGILF